MDDCISRRAVEKITWEEPSYTDPLNVLTEIREKVRALPPVTPKEKTGKWISVEYPTGVEAFGIKEMTAVALRCSVCEKEVDISDGDFKLCPYCGAKMVEPQESEGKE